MRSDIKLPSEILEEINNIIPSEDPLDDANFNEVEYINKLFPTEQSLVNIDEIISKFENDISVLDNEIRQNLHEQIETEAEGLRMLDDAQQYIKKLVGQIGDIKSKAETSELMVKEMTQDIRQLDQAKQNLTLSITTLNHLHMLVGGIESLEKLIPQRKYGEIANLLQGVLNVLENFNYCMDIGQIKEMATKVYDLRDTVGKQISEDFKNSMTGSGPRVLHNPLELYEACRVIDIMQPTFKKEFIDWFVDFQLTEYSLLYQETQDDGWLDKVDKRYSWFKKYANDFTERFFGVFPANWEILKKVAYQFCEITRKQLSKAMYQRYPEIDVKLLLFAIQKTITFETLLSNKFKENDDTEVATRDDKDVSLDPELLNPFNQDSQNSANSAQIRSKTQGTIESFGKGAPVSPFIGIISRCFEDHLDIFLKSQERSIKESVDRFTEEARAFMHPNASGSSAILPSCPDLFVLYKNCLVQCNQLTRAQPMVGLARIFKTYLSAYAQKVMVANIPKTVVSSSNFREIASTFLKEATNKLTPADVSLLCILIGSAEYCSETTRQLESKMKEKVDAALENEITFQEEIDTFQGIIGTCINTLIQDAESACEPHLITMANTNWMSCEGVGDQSKYVTSIIQCLKSIIPPIRDGLSESRKYFTQFCIRFVNSFIPKYLTSLYKCKPVGTVGAEQLLLDTHSIKTILLDLPSLGLNQTKKAPVSFTKIVIKGMTKAEMILKVVMTPHDSVPLFVENCAKLLPDLDLTEFQKILDIKGIKRNEQTFIIEAFKEHQAKQSKLVSDIGTQPAGKKDPITEELHNPFPLEDKNASSSSTLPSGAKSLPITADSAPSKTGSAAAAVNYFLTNDPRIKKLERLIKKKNPM